MQSAVPQQAPTRRLGLVACIALVVGNMVGSGIFLLPASLATYGPIAIAGWVVTGAGAIALAIIFGRLARAMPKTGGPYAYTRASFGEFMGFLIAWGYWVALWAGNAGVAVAFAGYAGHFFPAIAGGFGGLAVALAVLWLVTLINLRGVGEAGLVQIVATALKLLPLLAIAIVGPSFIDTANFTPINSSGQGAFPAIAACAALTLWAFLGLESATVPAGDVYKPNRTIPLATIIGTVFAACIYIVVTAVALGTTPRGELAASPAPLALVADRLWGSTGALLVALGALISTFGTLNGFTLLAGQVPLGAAQDGTFPAWFGALSRKGAPTNALLAAGVLSSALIAMSLSQSLVDQFTFIILLATFASLVPYAFCAFAELVLLAQDPAGYRRPKGLTGLIVLSLAAFAYAGAAIYGIGPQVVFWGFILLLSGLPIYVWLKFRQPQVGVGALPPAPT